MLTKSWGENKKIEHFQFKGPLLIKSAMPIHAVLNTPLLSLGGLLSFDVGPKAMAVFDFCIEPKPKNWFRSQTSECNGSTYQKFTTTTYEKTQTV